MNLTERRKRLLNGSCRGFNISIPAGLKIALIERAQYEDLPASRIVRRALLNYLTDSERSDSKELAAVNG